MTLLIVPLLLLAIGFGIAAVTGAPYVPAFTKDVEQLLKNLGKGNGKLLVDLGCGDGKVLIMAANMGYQAIGYEINPILWLIAKWRTRKQRQQISVRFGNFWSKDLSNADVVFVFLIDRYMKKLEVKLKRELKKSAVVVSYVFRLPRKKPYQTTKNAAIYRF